MNDDDDVKLTVSIRTLLNGKIKGNKEYCENGKKKEMKLQT